MTLACTCGSVALEFEEQHYPDNGGLAYERYRCEACGQTGEYEFGTKNGRHVEEMRGCLTDNGHY